jgi:hypothetical protein
MSPAPGSSRRRRPAGPQGLDRRDRRGQSDRWYFSTNLPRDHRTAGVDVQPRVSLNSLYELTDNSALGGRSRPKTTTTALTILSPTFSTPVVQARCKFPVLAA